MKAAIIPLVFLILAAPALSAEYWIVTGDDINDVLTGANMAASMKATLGVEFSGKTMDEVTATLPRDDVLVVYLDRRNAVIMPDDFSYETPVVQEYLQDQGYGVAVDDDFSLLLGEEAESDREHESDAPSNAEGPSEGTTPQVVRVEDLEETPPPPADVPPKSVPNPSPENDVQPEPEKKPNVVVRVWKWFAGLFS